MSRAMLPEVGRDGGGDGGLTIAAAFIQQAARTPDAVAVIHRECRLTYREVDARSNQIARVLRGMSVGTEELVGVLMPRTEMLPVALLAVLKAGGAYVPLDPAHPAERLAMMIKDADLRVILTAGDARSALPAEVGRTAVMDIDAVISEAASEYAIENAATAANLAYVIYTSGSTGKPKGVMVEHRSVMNFFRGMDAVLGVDPGVWLAVTSVAFDISVLELLWTLTRGSTVVVVDTRDSEGPITAMINHHVTHAQMTPSLARLLLLAPHAEDALRGLKQLLLGGEALPPALARQLSKTGIGQLFNMYGPTETTIWSTVHRLANVGPSVDPSSVPIGRAIPNTQLYILGENQRPVVQGKSGELFIGGAGVARGYWDRLELTAERFVDLPAAGGKRVYRTGDVVRMLDDGAIEFIGRCDHQVKIRGHRIELGEIEALLEQQLGVRQAVVMSEEHEGNARLVAWLTTRSGAIVDASALKQVLARRLPDAMIPSAIAIIAEMPLTANGKVDRRELRGRDPLIQRSEQSEVTVTEMEQLVRGVWQLALGVSTVGLQENFFDLGAHSMTVAEVHAKLEEKLSISIALVDLFQFTNVRTLAAHLAGATPEVSAARDAFARAERRRRSRRRFEDA